MFTCAGGMHRSLPIMTTVGMWREGDADIWEIPVWQPSEHAELSSHTCSSNHDIKTQETEEVGLPSLRGGNKGKRFLECSLVLF